MRFLCLILTAALIPMALAQRDRPLLDEDDVWLLVMNTPAMMDVECRKGCPEIEFQRVGENRMWALVTNRCPLSGNGTLGTFTVDLRDGRIWPGIDPVKVIDSDRLQRLRKILLSRQRLKSQAITPAK